MIAAGTMLADHIAGVFLDPGSAVAIVLHLIGRISFPLILFLGSFTVKHLFANN